MIYSKKTNNMKSLKTLLQESVVNEAKKNKIEWGRSTC